MGGCSWLSSLPYALVAFCVWPVLKVTDAAVKRSSFLVVMLSDAKLCLVLGKLAALDFKPSAAHSFVEELKALVAKHPSETTFVLHASDLLDIAAFTTTLKLPSDVEYIQDMTLESLLHRGSCAAMGLLELLLAPRLTRPERVDAANQTCAVLRAMASHAYQTPFVKPQLAIRPNSQAPRRASLGGGEGH